MNDLFANDYDLSHLEKITTKRYGFNLFVTPRFKYHYVDMVYEETTALLMRQNAKGVSTFIDVGAHYGFFDVLVGLSNPKCKILAFEPVLENCEILRKNLALNNINASVYQFAVSDQPGRASFQVSDASDNSGFIANPAVGVVRNIETDVVQLDQYLSQIPDGPVLIKIDTEGNEIKVLEGMQKIIEKCSDLRLVIEFNPVCLEANGESPQALLDKIFELGFDTFFIYDEEGRYEKYHQGQEWRDFMGERTYRNLYCARKNRTTNVLIFSHSSMLAGAERSTLELVKELTSDHGTICTVVLPSPGLLEGLLQQAGAATLIAPLNWWCAGTEPLDNAEIRQLYSQSFGWLIENLQILRQINPDVVLTSTLVIPWGAVAAYLLKRHHIWNVHEFGELDHGLKFFLPFPQILSFIEESSDKIVTCSKAIQIELYPHQDSNKIDTIYYYINIPDKKNVSDESNDNYFLLPDALHLIISGTVIKSKGQEDAVRAVIELIKNRKRKVELVIAGYAQPDFLSYLQEIINAEGVSDYIHIVPFQENIISIVNSADIVLVCSRMEGFGRVTLEAMLMEKAVIATNTGGTKEMIFDGETGLLYTPGNYIRLADQIEKLLDDPNERLNLAHNAYRFAKKTFTKKKFGGEYHKILVDLKNKDYQNKEEMSWFITNQYQILLEQKDLEMQALTAQVAEKEQSVQALTAQVVEKEQSVQALTAQVAEKEQVVQVLTAQVAEKEQFVQALSVQVAEKDQSVQALTAQVAEKEQSVQALTAQVTEIINSKAWKIALLFRRIRVLLAPPNSRCTRGLRRLIKVIFAPFRIIREKRKLKEDLALIRSSDLFDADWYLANNPDVAQTKMDPPLHYLRNGGFEGRDPRPSFSSAWYLDAYEDVKKSGMNPLVHYLKHGKTEKRDINEDSALIRTSDMFDEEWYLEHYSDVTQDKTDYVIHYLLFGGFEGRDPNPNFDSDWYLDACEDVKKSGMNPLVHYLKYGKQEGREAQYPDMGFVRSCGLFDEEWYIANNPDVAQAKVDPLLHYLIFGGLEGCDPHPLFESSFYLSNNPDVAKSGMNPLVHYLRNGGLEGRDPHPLFDGSFYLSNNPDVAASGMNPLVHYLRHGGLEGLDPNPYFNGSLYLEMTPEIKENGLNPLIHYLLKSRENENAGVSISEQSMDDVWLDENVLKLISDLSR